MPRLEADQHDADLAAFMLDLHRQISDVARLRDAPHAEERPVRVGLVTVLQSGNKASILVAIFFMMFFSYGHFIRSVAYVFSLSGRLEQAKSLLQGRFADSFWLLFWMAIFTVITLLILKNRGKSIYLRKLFQFISIGALITVAFNWFSYVVREPNNEVNLFIKDWQAETSSEVPQNIRQDEHFDNQKLPEIYYIVLDGLGRADTLKEYYGADLTPVITFLRNKGFCGGEGNAQRARRGEGKPGNPWKPD